jgi:hypothetical protein
MNIIDDLFALCLFPVLRVARQPQRTGHHLSPSLPLHLPVALSIPLLFLRLESGPDGLVDDPFARELTLAGVECVELTARSCESGAERRPANLTYLRNPRRASYFPRFLIVNVMGVTIASGGSGRRWWTEIKFRTRVCPRDQQSPSLRGRLGLTISAREECADKLRMMAATRVILQRLVSMLHVRHSTGFTHSIPHDFFGPPLTPYLSRLHPISNPFFPIIQPKSYQFK